MVALRSHFADRSSVALSDPPTLDQPTFLTGSNTLLTMKHIAWSELPDDVRECEVSVVFLFRASQMLNFLTGGSSDMTLSARVWRSQRIARRIEVRMGWMLLRLGIDFSCVVLRREQDHCETAWINYILRARRQ